MLLRRDTQGAVDAAAYLAEIAHRVRTIHGAGPQASLHLDLEPLLLAPTAAAPLGLLLHEALSNAFGRICHDPDGADPATKAAEVAVKLRREPEGWTRLVVENRGRRSLVPQPGSMRARLVAALARQIGGALEYEAAGVGHDGSRLSLLAPLARVMQGASTAVQNS